MAIGESKSPDAALDRENSDDPTVEHPLAVVGMGASAGALEAFQTFLDNMPVVSGLAFILVHHIDPSQETLMPELLARYTEMPVVQAADLIAIRPDHVYVIPSNAGLTIRDGVLRVSRPAAPRGERRPIDALLESLAEAQGARAVAIILSGTGSDGAEGVKAIKEHGGLTMVQSFESARYDGMPRRAVETGQVDHVLDVEDMPARLVAYAKHIGEIYGGNEAAVAADDIMRHLGPICRVLNRKVQHDFSWYKSSTLQRRVQRRMLVLQISSATDYVDRLRRDDAEARQLFKELLIGVTAFFRDRDAFAAIQQTLRTLVAEAGDQGRIRIWITACASGEEAYSMAMSLRDEMDRSERELDVQLFATDIDEGALAIAREGRYPAAVVEQIDAERLSRYFVREDEGYRVVSELRSMCIFSRHNLIRDPPFSRVDLLSCRNVLIYLESDLQAKLIPLLHYALRPGGYLFLGPAENITAFPHLFHPIDKKHRIFQAKDVAHRPGVQRAALSFPLLPPSDAQGRRAPSRAQSSTPATPDDGRLLQRRLAEEFGPPAALIDERGKVLYLSGHLGIYLEHTSGPVVDELVGLARRDIRLHLRTTIHKAQKTGKEVVTPNLAVRVNGAEQRFDLIVTPFSEAPGMAGLWIVVFRETEPPRAASEAQPPQQSKPDEPLVEPLVEQLESELESTRQHLQSTIQELETSNEELKSSNEELLSMNEELQSSNEELQTSKEELQSTNEELETINNELQNKIDELDRAHADLQNLFESTRIPTVFLDRRLRVQQFTPVAKDVFRLINADRGRPLADIAHRVSGVDLVREAEEVLRTLTPREVRVRRNDDDGPEHRYLLRILPYRTMTDVIDGVVLAFLEVTALEQATERVQLRERQQAVVAELGLRALAPSTDPSAEPSAAGALIRDAVAAVCETLRADVCEVLELEDGGDAVVLRAGIGWPDDAIGEATFRIGRDMQMGYALRLREPLIVDTLAEEKRFRPAPLLIEQGIVSCLSCGIRAGDETYGVLGVHTRERRRFSDDDANFVVAVANVVANAIKRARDLDELRRSEEGLRRHASELRTIYDTAGVGLALLDRGGRFVTINRKLADMHARPIDDLLGKRPGERFPDLATALDPHIAQALDRGAAKMGIEVEGDLGRSGMGTRIWQCDIIPIDGAAGGADAVSLVVTDVTSRRQAERDLRESQQRLERTIETAQLGVAFLRADGVIAECNDALLAMLGYEREELHARGLRWSDLLSPEQAGAESEAQAELQRKGRLGPKETLIVRKDGERLPVLTSTSLAGVDDEAVVFVLDLTESLRTEERYRQQANELQMIYDTAPVGLAVIDREHRFLELNRILAETEGVSAEEQIGRSAADILPGMHDRAPALIDRVFATGEPVMGVELESVTGAGEQRYWLCSYAPTRDHAGEVVAVSCVVQDITDRKRFEELLRRTNRHKDEFLAMLGHELRNPLAAIRSVADILKMMPVDDARVEHIRGVLDRQSAHMAKLVDGLLDVARIARGKVKLEPQRLDVCRLLEEVVHDRRAELEVRGLDFSLDLPPEQLWVEGDRTRLAQVVDNLLGNAIKFTQPPGSITLAARREENMAVVRVEDSGVGIEPELIEYIFEPFQQASQSLDRAAGGLGLGLALVRAVVELHGGQVSAHSGGRNHGAAFTARLPLATAAHEPAAPATGDSEPAAGDASRRILLVEDNHDSAEMLRIALELSGCDVAVAHDGAQALALADTFAPDVVLCDIGLPGDLSGYDVAQALRRQRGTDALMMIALTGYGRPEDQERAHTAGFDAHLTKPVDLLALEAVLARGRQA